LYGDGTDVLSDEQRTLSDAAFNVVDIASIGMGSKIKLGLYATPKDYVSAKTSTKLLT